MDALLWAGIASSQLQCCGFTPWGVEREQSISISLPTLLVSGCSNFILGWADMDKKTGVSFQFPCVKWEIPRQKKQVGRPGYQPPPGPVCRVEVTYQERPTKKIGATILTF